MNSDEENDDKSFTQEKRAESPDHSFISMKSDMSMDYPIAFKRRSTSVMESLVSRKSHESMENPVTFRSIENESDKTGTSDDFTPQLDHGDKHPASDTQSFYRAMEYEEDNNIMFKSKLGQRFQRINEGNSNYGSVTFLNDIFTELYITSDRGCGHISDEHEVRSLEKMCREATTDESIDCNDLFNPLPGDEKPIRVVLTEGVAGIGKTVCVQKFVVDWAEGKTNQDLNFVFPFSFRELNFIKHHLSLLELLHCFFPETKKIQMDFHRYKIMLILDGLDECRFSLDFINRTMLSDVTESASVNVLITNVIAGNLIPSALLWITSRPAASGQIPSAFISRVTEVRGFADPQKDEYFRKRIGDGTLADKIIAHLKSSRSLYIMCHVPVFCWIAVTVLEGMFSGPQTDEVPRTLTQMFTHFLVLQIKRGCHKYNKCQADNKTISDMVLKLGMLAFQQLEKGNVIFYEEDITKCGISVEEAAIFSGVCTQIFNEDETSHLGKVYSFVHLSVQEHLAAVFVFFSCVNQNETKHQIAGSFNLSRRATLLEHLKAAVNKALKIKNGHLDLFLRFLMGLSLQSNSLLIKYLLTETGHNSLDKDAAVTRKEIISYIKEQIEKNGTDYRSINLFHCLNELNDQTLVQDVQTFLSKTASHCLDGVKLGPVQWSALGYLLLNSSETSQEFDLQKYAASDECVMKLAHVIAVSRKAVLRDGNLTKKSCKSLAKVLSSVSSCVRELDLSNNNLQDSGLALISSGLTSSSCKLNTLHLNNCNLTEKSCSVLALVLVSKATRLTQLCLSGNKLQDSGVKHLSDALKNQNCKLEILRLNECNIKESCVTLTAALRSNTHLKQLEVNGNELKEQEVKLLYELLQENKVPLEQRS